MHGVSQQEGTKKIGYNYVQLLSLSGGVKT